MDGKPLLEALVQPAAPAPIPSWDDVPGGDGRNTEGFVAENPGEAAGDLPRQFAALGYIDDPGEDRVKAGGEAEFENHTISRRSTFPRVARRRPSSCWKNWSPGRRGNPVICTNRPTLT